MNQDVKAWMFRSKNEFLSLFFSIALLLVIGIILSTINFYMVVGLFFAGLIFIHLQQAQYLGSAVRVYESQFPKIYKEFVNLARLLRIRRATLYIKQDPNLNAFTLGVNKCTVVLTSALVEQLTPQELKFVLAHELGHFKAGHTFISSLINPIGMNNILNTYVFGFWQRKAEYTADRCGLVLTKDVNSSISGLIKLSIGGALYKSMDIQAYATQVSKSDGIAVKLSEMLSDHPLITNRVRNLLSFWKESFKNYET
jgi:Zn-dependent protease with chaperone function